MTGGTLALHVETAGAGDPPVVLVHAGIADRRMWDREFTRIARTHRVIRYDVRGFGRSPEPVEDYFDHEDLLAVLDTEGVERAVLIGASNGGRIVLDTAVVAPGRVTALVLAAPDLPGTPRSDELAAQLAAEEAAFAAGDIDRAAAINLQLFVDGFGRDPATVSPPARDAVRAWLDALLPRQAARHAAGVGAQLVEPLVRDRLGDVDVPALILIGRHDAPDFHTIARHLADRLPEARLIEVAGAAHLINVEQPERFTELVDDFVRSVTPR